MRDRYAPIDTAAMGAFTVQLAGIVVATESTFDADALSVVLPPVSEGSDESIDRATEEPYSRS